MSATTKPAKRKALGRGLSEEPLRRQATAIGGFLGEMVEGPRLLKLADISVSDSPAQVERRHRYDEEASAELVASIRELGVLQPIVVRPVLTDDRRQWPHFEVVAGERRLRAARVAGLEQMPCVVRVLDDRRSLEVQLVENLQREGLHELVEAEGYQALIKDHGLTHQEVAEKVGRSKSHVFGRLKLRTLGEAGMAAFRANEIPGSVALALARVPGGALQREALDTVTGTYLATASARSRIDAIQRKFMRDLGAATFKRDRHYWIAPTTRNGLDEPAFDSVDTYGGKLPLCDGCEYNTADRDRWPEAVAGRCAKPPCYDAKQAAVLEAKARRAEARGVKVLRTGAVDTYGSLKSSYIPAGGWEYRDLERDIGKKTTAALRMKAVVRGELVNVVARKDAAVALKAAHVEPPRDNAMETLRAETRRRMERLDAALEKLREAYGARSGEFEAIPRDVAAALLDALWRESHSVTTRRVAQRYPALGAALDADPAGAWGFMPSRHLDDADLVPAALELVWTVPTRDGGHYSGETEWQKRLLAEAAAALEAT